MENPEQPSKPKTPSPKCKVFEIALSNVATVGISPDLVTQAYPANGKILMGFLILGYGIYATSAFLTYDAETFTEYTQSFCICSFAILNISILLILMLKVEKMFELINACDQFVNTSKLR